jgi:hypothetical protein
MQQEVNDAPNEKAWLKHRFGPRSGITAAAQVVPPGPVVLVSKKHYSSRRHGNLRKAAHEAAEPEPSNALVLSLRNNGTCTQQVSDVMVFQETATNAARS